MQTIPIQLYYPKLSPFHFLLFQIRNLNSSWFSLFLTSHWNMIAILFKLFKISIHMQLYALAKSKQIPSPKFRFSSISWIFLVNSKMAVCVDLPDTYSWRLWLISHLFERGTDWSHTRSSKIFGYDGDIVIGLQLFIDCGSPFWYRGFTNAIPSCCSENAVLEIIFHIMTKNIRDYWNIYCYNSSKNFVNSAAAFIFNSFLYVTQLFCRNWTEENKYF